MTLPMHPCSSCGKPCQSNTIPRECGNCLRRRQAGEFWSPEVLTPAEGRWVGKGGIQVWQPAPKKRAKIAKCGTDGGYYRHIRRTKTKACEPCKQAHARAETERARKRLRSDAA